VPEYWAIGLDEAWKFVLREGKYVVEEIVGDQMSSEVLSGFVLDLGAARKGLHGGGDASDEME
jgi:hypothetical protein